MNLAITISQASNRKETSSRKIIRNKVSLARVIRAVRSRISVNLQMIKVLLNKAETRTNAIHNKTPHIRKTHLPIQKISPTKILSKAANLNTVDGQSDQTPTGVSQLYLVVYEYQSPALPSQAQAATFGPSRRTLAAQHRELSMSTTRA